MPEQHIGKYRVLKTLGQGTFATVKLARNTNTNEMVAIKIIDQKSVMQKNMFDQIKKEIVTEITIMKQLDHPLVIEIKEVLASRSKIFIVMEYASNGDLQSYLESKGGKLSEDEARKIFRQMVEGLQYIHSQGFCHRDLKLENFLLDSQGNVKISDFGSSNVLDANESPDHMKPDTDPSLLHAVCGTPYYLAPEVVAKQGYDGKTADVWSCGVILFKLLTGYFPFGGKLTKLFANIRRGQFWIPHWVSKDAMFLLRCILDKDPKQRITLEDIQKTAWYNRGYDPETPKKCAPIAVTNGQHAAPIRRPKLVAK